MLFLYCNASVLEILIVQLEREQNFLFFEGRLNLKKNRSEVEIFCRKIFEKFSRIFINLIFIFLFFYRTVYTGMQNDHGGYLTDLTLSRMGLH